MNLTPGQIPIDCQLSRRTGGKVAHIRAMVRR